MFKKLDSMVSKAILFTLKNWLLVINVLIFLFIVPIVIAPYLLAADNATLNSIGNAIMLIFKLTCHQIPSRSIEMIDGHCMAVCARCFAIYASFLAGGIIFAFVKDRLKPWSLKYYLLFCVPVALDGLTQLIGLRESSNEIRLITGAIFGLASSLYVYPYFQLMFAVEEKDLDRIIKKEAMKEAK